MADKKPQWMNLSPVTFNGTNYVETKTRTPSVISANMVLEAFRAVFETPPVVISGTATDQIIETQIAISTRSQSSMPVIGNSQLVAKVHYTKEVIYPEATETGASGVAQINITDVDLSDGAGNGVLIAADELFLGVIGSGAAFVAAAQARILYKATKVTSEELIGLALT